ncbi:hypothetical protein NLU13_8297 [Sarocladium strictum]|uniref:N-acetyltransferase domain-containing protein n=1 Tax=Sarocladium strictum TaxID=5046 RepID=A0AA39GC19_SARSR|nr:hypothetical protein NLU13_8297 [Sarocladium strictum]
MASASRPAWTPLEWVTVPTTLPVLPFPAYEVRPRFFSDRLCLRELKESDIELLAKLRSQPEVMKWTGQGRPDVDLSATRTHLATMLPPNDVSMFEFAISLKATDEFIGIGGCHKMNGELGWPVMGYMFRSEFWGQGFATEFVACFLDAWWQLPREEAKLQVDRATVNDENNSQLQSECLIAVTVDDNTASQNVLRKCGWSLVKVWTEPDVRDPSKEEVLYGFAATAATKPQRWP